MAGIMADTADLRDEVAKLLDEAWARGYRAGAEAARESILKAAALPMPLNGGGASHAPQDRAPPRHATKRKSRRASPGRVRVFLQDQLTASPGLIMAELQRLAKGVEGLSALSIPNELRRNEGELYRRDGARWFLAQTKSAEVPDEDTSADSLL